MEINDLLARLIESKGSDLHILAGLKPAIRINRRISPVEDIEPLDADQTRRMLYSALSDEQIHEFEDDPVYRYDMDVAYSVGGPGFRECPARARAGYGAGGYGQVNDAGCSDQSYQ